MFSHGKSSSSLSMSSTDKYIQSMFSRLYVLIFTSTACPHFAFWMFFNSTVSCNYSADGVYFIHQDAFHVNSTPEKLQYLLYLMLWIPKSTPETAVLRAWNAVCLAYIFYADIYKSVLGRSSPHTSKLCNLGKAYKHGWAQLLNIITN